MKYIWTDSHYKHSLMENYLQKFAKIKQQTFFNSLPFEEQEFIRSIAFQYRFTYQDLRQICENALDLNMWGEPGLQQWWKLHDHADKEFNKDAFINKLRGFIEAKKKAAKEYRNEQDKSKKWLQQPRYKIIQQKSDKNIFGRCPVESEKTVCCNLKTIDAVESCVFGCSYCTIQTFYNEQVTFDKDLTAKLNNIKLDPNRRYHIGTGQSSDSLAFGNRNGLLDDLCQFAADNPNVLLEFKTKSDNIRYFFEHDVPPNIVCSWSLNPQVIIDNEEHYTANLDKRIAAAEAIAKRGVKVSFHFHPIVYYSDWAAAYPLIADELIRRFSPEQILFISFGSVTFIKPVLKKIRKMGFPTKITQMQFVTDPHGKMTYPDDIKVEKFRRMYQSFEKWHDQVFFYLCMEKSEIWQRTFEFVYPDNASFESALLESSFSKLS